MLVSSPSPSALRPSPSSPSFPPPLSRPSHNAAPAAPVPPHPPPVHRHTQTPPQPPTLQYEPVAHPAPVSATNKQHLSPHSSCVAIEELRSALNRHTVAPSPQGPSGDHPRGCMTAGRTSSGGGHTSAEPTTLTTLTTVTTVTNPATTAATQPTTQPTTTVPDHPPPSGPPVSTAQPPAQTSLAPPMPAPNSSGTTGSNKRNSPTDPSANGSLAQALGNDGSQPKRLRANQSTVKLLPVHYEHADPRDLVVLISSMLMELIRYNDKIPLNQGRLTRFHSRSPPRISVQDYLQRLATHATLSPPILLSMVYYIDRLCALYPAFTVSSLTIHRFLITSATVASKGLSDSFWTNKTYARVGGISMAELFMLELEFLFRVEWRIVPQPEVLVDYYQSLVERCEGYEIQRPNPGA